jgi:hypothetical protein
MTQVSPRLRQVGLAAVVGGLLCLMALALAPAASATGEGFFSPTGSLSAPRVNAAAALLPDGRVLVVGGSSSGTSAEVFDPATNTFSSAGIGSMSVPRRGAVAAPLPDGRVLVAGGCCTAWPYDPLSSAEVFDPATNTFSSAGIGSMTTRREGAVAAPLPDGRVLVAGGFYYNSTSALSSAEVFDPATNTFSSAGIGSMSIWRAKAAAARLPDARVLVVGGASGTSDNKLSSAEVFDPATDTFSAVGIGSMSRPRFAPVAAALPDGRVLVAGGNTGFDMYPCTLSSAEVFDPTTSSFSSAASMSVPRHGAVAASLTDGVLVAGGSYGVDASYRGCPSYYSGDASTCAEIFKLGVPPERPVAACNPPSREADEPTIKPITCRGQQATVVGTNGADQITGTRGADVIVGLRGNDTLSGRGANDVICGDNGRDTLKGGEGNDTLYGDAGKDTLRGGPGADTLMGGPGKDRSSSA